MANATLQLSGTGYLGRLIPVSATAPFGYDWLWMRVCLVPASLAAGAAGAAGEGSGSDVIWNFLGLLKTPGKRGAIPTRKKGKKKA